MAGSTTPTSRRAPRTTRKAISAPVIRSRTPVSRRTLVQPGFRAGAPLAVTRDSSKPPVMPILLAILLALGVSVSESRAVDSSPPPPDFTVGGPAPTAQSLLSRLPARFEPNVGQAPAGLIYTLKTSTYLASLSTSEIHFALASGIEPGELGDSRSFEARARLPQQEHDVVSMRFLGANPQPLISAEDRQEGISNYFLGDKPEEWHSGVPGYSAVRYSQLWPGIDLIFRDDRGNARYDFEIAAGADPSQIKIAVEGGLGTRIDDEAQLVISTSNGEMTHGAPLSYQELGPERTEVKSRFVIDDSGAVGFAVSDYDPRQRLTIDPTITYSTYRGGSAWDLARSVSVGYMTTGNSAVVVGATQSTNYPTAFPYQSSNAGDWDAFVTRLNPTGSGVAFSTYLGGSGWDGAWDVKLGAGDQPHIVGITDSTNFPTSAGVPTGADPIQPSSGGSSDAFVTELFWNGGSLFYSSYMGGSSADGADGVTYDDWTQSTYITGWTNSSNFPTASPLQGSYGGAGDAFAAKMSISGDFVSGLTASLNYSTYLGGSGGDNGAGIAIGPGGDAYLVGTTYSTNFPTASPIQASNAGGSDAFVSKLNPAGSSLVYSTYVGGSSSEFGNDIDVDYTMGAHVVGMTASTNFPTALPFQGANAGGDDAFVTLVNAAGSALERSSYLGGSGSDGGQAIAVDTAKNAHVTGFTTSTDFPTILPLQASSGGGPDAFVTKIKVTDSALRYSSYIGGSGSDDGQGIATDPTGIVYMAGYTDSTNFPTVSPIQSANAGAVDAFMLRIDETVASISYLAEGSTLGGFETWIVLANPSVTETVDARITYFTSTGPRFGGYFQLLPQTRVSILVNDRVADWNVSTKVEGIRGPLFVERALYSSQPGIEGAHLGKAIDQPASSWFLPEGSTGPGFETWVLVANPDPVLTATASITYLTGTGPVTRPDVILQPQTRQSIRVNDTVTTYDVSTKVTSTGANIVAERATYVTSSEYKGATDSPGTSQPASSWFLGEGSTGPGFDTWILVANPNTTLTATAQITYMTSSGPVTGPSLLIPPSSRRTVKANDTVADWNVSTRVTSTGADVVCERAMYATTGSRFGKTAATGEGVVSPANTWLIPEGATAGGFETWVLVANPDPVLTATATLTYLTDSGPVAGPTLTLGPQTRQSVRANDSATTYDIATKVVSTGAPIVADHSVYLPPGALVQDATAGPGIPVV